MRRAALPPCAAMLLAACGSAPPPKEPPAARVEAPERAVPLVAKTSSELGTVDPAAVKKAFSVLDAAFLECQKRALERVEVLAGQVKFFLRINEDGSAKYAYLEESDVGDRDTEKCLREVVMRGRWPKPEGGGEAEVRYAMELPLQSTRPPNDWSSDKVAPALGKRGSAIDQCKAAAPGTFRGTMYVGTGGKVLAAGVAASTRDAAEKADCLADVLLKMKGLPSPGSWPAKVSFGL